VPPEPKNRVIPKSKPHEHPSIYCYKKWGTRGCGRPHDHDECREKAVTWQRENRRKHGGRRGAANATLRSSSLSPEELAKLRKQVGYSETSMPEER
jgi:hypothetical protein